MGNENSKIDQVWAPSDTTGYELATIHSELPNEKVEVKFSDERIVKADKSQLVLYTPESLTIENDLIKLSTLNEPTILYNLMTRFAEDTIYTFVGPMVISVNPFKALDIYSPQLIQAYAEGNIDQLPPHLFSTSMNAFRSLQDLGKSQSIIISGESGAGKTEATKIILKFLTTISDAGSGDLASAILASNPILEAFGNAKTVRNNNSSRFGKFIKIKYSKSSVISGAEINNYLLESTRVIFQAPTERNYHIFYQFLKGASPELRQRYFLDYDVNKYKILTDGDIVIEGTDDADDFTVLLQAFEDMSIGQDEVDQILSIVAAILHLGNVTFTGTDQVKVDENEHVEAVCSLLQIDHNSFCQGLSIRFMQANNRNTTYFIPLTAEQAVENRNAMAKTLYSRLFDYLVQRINQRLSSSRVGQKDTDFIAVLDIYGFECFQTNSMEQLCINYANEKLHEQFNEVMFKMEQAEYEKEGVPWTPIGFVDNSECIKLLEMPAKGLLSMINEEVRIPKGTDESLRSKLVNVHPNHAYIHSTIAYELGFAPRTPNVFSINHYAGAVPYTLTGFLDKNRNVRNVGVDQAMWTSEMSLIKNLFDDKQSKERAKSTVLQDFKKDLLQLFDVLNASSRHYVRCLKPNDLKKPGIFQGSKVLEQLKSNGVLETVRLRKAGYAQKFLFEEFISRYSGLGFTTCEDPHEFGACMDRIEALATAKWALGHTKIFLTTSTFAILESERKKHFGRVILSIQSSIRSYHAKRLLEVLIEERQRLIASIVLQSLIRRFTAWAELDLMREQLRLLEEQRQERLRQIRETLYSLKDLPDWTPAQVCSWLLDTGFEELVDKFLDEEVTGGHILDMDAADLRDCLDMDDKQIHNFDIARIALVERYQIENATNDFQEEELYSQESPHDEAENIYAPPLPEPAGPPPLPGYGESNFQLSPHEKRQSRRPRTFVFDPNETTSELSLMAQEERIQTPQEKALARASQRRPRTFVYENADLAELHAQVGPPPPLPAHGNNPPPLPSYDGIQPPPLPQHDGIQPPPLPQHDGLQPPPLPSIYDAPLQYGETPSLPPIDFTYFPVARVGDKDVSNPILTKITNEYVRLGPHLAGAVFKEDVVDASETAGIADTFGWDPNKPVPFLDMRIHNITFHTESTGSAFCKKYAKYEIHIDQAGKPTLDQHFNLSLEFVFSGVKWSIFRRYSQLFELDKKLKKHGLLDKSDVNIPPKTGLKRDNSPEMVSERVVAFQRYFKYVINHPAIRRSQYVYLFVGPFQLGDTRPNPNVYGW